ncbi:MAG: ornithine cyclodeaminase family protein, partial [Mesorhizobium sp.]
TSSFKPILKASQVRPGTHIACMGTDTKGKQEVEPEILARAIIFADEITQSATIGEAQHAVELGLITSAEITEIGAVIRGDHIGRTDAEEITLFDGTGVGLQDLAVASAAVEKAISKGVAVEVDF